MFETDDRTAQTGGEYREAVTLFELEGLTQNATAKQLGLSVSSMKSHVQRGLRQLNRMLDDCCKSHLDWRRSVTAYSARSAVQSLRLPPRYHSLLRTVTIAHLGGTDITTTQAWGEYAY